MIAFSTSGKSREVLEILELARHLGVSTIIGITSHPDSELRELSDLILDMGIIEEPCPLGLTPSASMAVMLAISDAIALSLLEQKGVTKEDWGLRHHGGYLGRAARKDNLPH
jgi:arabinose-5-phosphate isomerase